MNEIVMTFASELAQAVSVTAEKVTDVFDIISVTTEVAESVLARYQRKHPQIFNQEMKVRTVNLCQCGKCRTAIMIQANKALGELIIRSQNDLS